MKPQILCTINTINVLFRKKVNIIQSTPKTIYKINFNIYICFLKSLQRIMKKQRYKDSYMLLLSEVTTSYAQKTSVFCLHLSRQVVSNYLLSDNTIPLLQNAIPIKNRYIDAISNHFDQVDVSFKSYTLISSLSI